MFDFTPVGFSIMALGVVLIGLVGWRLVPGRTQADVVGFATGTYLTEALVPEGGKAAGMKLREIEAGLEELVQAEAQHKAQSHHRQPYHRPGGGGGRLLRLHDANRAPEQHPDPRTGRPSLR